MKRKLSAILRAVKKMVQSVGGIFHSKYTEIILAVALFILLDAGVLIINFYTSYQIANDAHAIHIASRMGTLSQSLLHELYQVNDDANNPDADYFETIDTLANSYKLFDETLDAFIYGGELIGEGQGQDSLLNDPVYRNTSAHLLKEAEDIWKDYRVKLKPIVYAYFNDAERSDIITASEIAVVSARQHSAELLQLMQSFAGAVEDVAKRKAERLRTIQSVGISLAVINFFLILFHFLKRLRHSDLLVERSRKETKNILQNVNEGLFLLDQDYKIESQHSTSLHALFKDDHLAGQHFIELLRKLVSDKTLETVEEFTEILFSPRVNESLISDLNPLKKVEVHLAKDDASFDIRYFSFQFARVYEKKTFKTLLVTVKDITEQVQLSEQLKVASERSGKEIDMLLAIIHVDNQMLTDFLKTTEAGLEKVNEILRKRSKGDKSFRFKLESLARVIHKLKGDSTALGLDFVMEKFHAFENEIAATKEKENVLGEDFLPLVVKLKQLMSDFTVIRNLQEKMMATDIQGALQLSELKIDNKSNEKSRIALEDNGWSNQLKLLVKNVAHDHGKKVALDLSGFDVEILPEMQLELVKDIVVQSLRNAVVHGIEVPEQREKVGKTREGKLEVMLAKSGTDLQLTVRDDGQGLDLEKIKKTAISKKIATENQLATWKRSKLVSLIFRQGFSTEESGFHAGQGVGMDLVKTTVDSLNGKIKLKHQLGEYTEFLYTFQLGNSAVHSS